MDGSPQAEGTQASRTRKQACPELLRLGSPLPTDASGGSKLCASKMGVSRPASREAQMGREEGGDIQAPLPQSGGAKEVPPCPELRDRPGGKVPRPCPGPAT